MSKYKSLLCLIVVFSFCCKSIAQAQHLQKGKQFMIRHTVVFKLKRSVDSAGVQNFFIAAKKLATIPGVQKFESLKQTSKKNNFEYGLSMEFANEELYQQYNKHPMHVQFIKEYWANYIEDFLEIDYELML